MKKGTLFVISAPSGAGKSTLIKIIRPMFPEMLYSISCATRAKRKGEIEGKDYYFVTKDKFQEMIEAGEFIEWKLVHGNMYGTPARPLRKAIETGQSMILDIDVEGAKEVFRAFPDAVGIFINAPDMMTLEKRLRLRGTESEESIATRLANALRENEMASIFQYQIVNDDLEKAVSDLAAVIRKESREMPSRAH
jgi:guanylate kinase